MTTIISRKKTHASVYRKRVASELACARFKKRMKIVAQT
jgi:hypothetical protein